MGNKKQKRTEEQIENIINETEDIQETRAFTDDADIAKHMQTVHNQKDFDLDTNYIQMKAEGNEKLKEFIRKQHTSAVRLYELIPYKPIAQKAYQLIMLETKDLAIMNRNVKGNMLLEGLMNRGSPRNELEKLLRGENTGTEKAGIKGAVKRFFFPDKKKKEETIIGSD